MSFLEFRSHYHKQHFVAFCGSGKATPNNWSTSATLRPVGFDDYCFSFDCFANTPLGWFRYTITYKTEYIKNTLNPKWKRFTVPVRTLCNGDMDRSIKVECYDWNSNGTHDIIGSFLTNLRELSNGKGSTFHVSRM